MSGRSSLASILMACLLAIGFVGLAPVVNQAGAGQPLVRSGESARNNIIRIKRRARRVRIHLPIGPSYIYYDYPYYYSRGYYPTHIGGYVYYPHHHYRRYHPRYVDPRSLRPQRSHSN